MTQDDPKPAQPSGTPRPAEKGRSGEGAATALQALIKRRKQVEGHEDTLPPEPQQPAP